MDFEVLFDTNDGALFWGAALTTPIYSFWNSTGKMLYADNNDGQTATIKHAYRFLLQEKERLVEPDWLGKQPQPFEYWGDLKNLPGA